MIRTVTSHRAATSRTTACQVPHRHPSTRSPRRITPRRSTRSRRRLQRAVPYPNAYAQQNYTYAQPPAAYPTYLPRNKYVAAALALFFGIFGLHNFYLGYTGKGVAQVLISVLTFGIGAIAVMIWAIVEAIQILTADYGTEHHRDARGVELQD